MELWLAADPPFFGGPGQGVRQIIELFVAFGLTALIGLERELQGKSAGIRTQTIVGTAAALILLVSKYGFADVLQPGKGARGERELDLVGRPLRLHHDIDRRTRSLVVTPRNKGEGKGGGQENRFHGP